VPWPSGSSTGTHPTLRTAPTDQQALLLCTPHPFPASCPLLPSLLPANAFSIYPPSTARSVGIVTMVLDQLTAYGLFVHPLLITWEKGLRVHHRPWYIRLPARLPVGEWVPGAGVCEPHLLASQTGDRVEGGYGLG
jgi:hypothetical protein